MAFEGRSFALYPSKWLACAPSQLLPSGLSSDDYSPPVESTQEVEMPLVHATPHPDRPRSTTRRALTLVGIIMCASAAGALLTYLGVSTFDVGHRPRGRSDLELSVAGMGAPAPAPPAPAAPWGPAAPAVVPARVAVDFGSAAGLLTRLATGGPPNCTDLESRGLRHLRMLQLVPEATRSCPRCGAGLSSACCFSWTQGELAVPCSRLNASARATLNVTLSLEEGLSPGLALFIRRLPHLSASQRARLIRILQADYGVYELSQMGSIYPAEVVEKLGLESKAEAHVLLAMLFREFGSQDPTLGEGSLVAPNSGGQMGLRQLIAQQGLLRGVMFSPKSARTNLGQVATFKAHIAAMSEAGLEEAVLMQPDVETQVLVIEAVSAQRSASMNAMMSAMGASGVSAQAKSNSLSRADGASADASTSSSSSSALTFSEIPSSTTRQFFMDRYYVQPQAFVSLGASMLQPSQVFSEAVQLINDERSGYTVKDLFGEFGSHVCLGTELGGWWKVSASVVSTKAQSTVGMSTASTAAIDSVTSKAKSTSPGASINRSKSSGTSSQSSSHAAGDSKEELNSSVDVEVSQEWKGGTSHADLAAWLASITPEHNSNWKVVNRRISDCVGIWQFVRDPAVRHAVCVEYLTSYLTEMNMYNWTTQPSAAQLRAAAPTVYTCRCTSGSLAYSTSPPVEGNNAIECTPSPGGSQMYCSTPKYYCNSPHAVNVTVPSDSVPLLCSTDVNKQWLPPSSTTIATTTAQASSSVSASISDICLGAADIKTVTQRVEEMVAKTAPERAQTKISSCDSTPGYHWSGSATTGECKENRCTCGSEVGTTGPACPVDGQEVCTPSQQAVCDEGACAVPGYWYNGTRARCLTSACSATQPDISRCCAPVSQGNNFFVRLAAKSSGSCHVSLTISGPDPGQSISSHHSSVSIDGNAVHEFTASSPSTKGFTPTRICLTLDECVVTVSASHLPSGVAIYNGGVSTTAGASNEVGCAFGSWEEFSGDTRTQCSAVSKCR